MSAVYTVDQIVTEVKSLTFFSDILQYDFGFDSYEVDYLVVPLFRAFLDYLAVIHVGNLQFFDMQNLGFDVTDGFFDREGLIEDLDEEEVDDDVRNEIYDEFEALLDDLRDLFIDLTNKVLPGEDVLGEVRISTPGY